MAQDVCLCVDSLAAGMINTSCYIDVITVQFFLLRMLWGLFPLALIVNVFFPSPPLPVAFKCTVTLLLGATVERADQWRQTELLPAETDVRNGI